MTRFQSLLLLISLLLSLPVFSEQRSAAEQLSAHLQPMESLEARFEQIIRDTDGTILQSASGLLAVKRPRHFYWRTEQPYEHLVVTEGKTLWLYDIDLEQISRQAFNSNLDKAPALLLSGEVDVINQQYQVEVTDSSTDAHFILTPKNTDSLFQQLEITFREGLVRSMVLRDSFDQVTTIAFTDVALNPVLDDGLFRFVPPEGIDIITDEP